MLLVEDNKDDMTLFLRTLKDANLAPKMLIAWNGIEALSLMFEMGNPKEEPPVIAPKLIVLDLMLPKASGFELLARLKSNPHTQNIPTVVLSSLGGKNNLAECYKLGVNSFLIKPVEFEKFSEMVQTLIRYWLNFNQTI